MSKKRNQTSIWKQMWLAVRDSAEVQFVQPKPALVPILVRVQESLPPVRVYTSESGHLWIDR